MAPVSLGKPGGPGLASGEGLSLSHFMCPSGNRRSDHFGQWSSAPDRSLREAQTLSYGDQLTPTGPDLSGF